MKSVKYLFAFIPIIFFSVFLFAQAPQIIPTEHPDIVGLWEFNNESELTVPTIGNSLVLNGSHTAIAGPSGEDGAVSIGSGSYYTCYHDIAGNGGGSEVNEYSLVFDFRVSSISEWHCFYQANASNSNDGELFINTSGQIGRTTSGPGYSSYSVIPNEWYRMVVAVDLGNFYRVYLDGALILNGGSLSVNGEYSLYPVTADNLVHFFADNNGEDAQIDIALAAIYNKTVDQTEVTSLGGYGHNINPIPVGILPYLQTPTPTSIYINWHSALTGSTRVDYGTSEALGQTQTGSSEDISGKKWHTVKLSGLMPETVYYYKCVSETQESEIYNFKTPSSEILENQHLRFLLLGDSRTDIAKTTDIAFIAKNKAVEMYGSPIYENINMIVHVGDIVSSGGTISQYENEYFNCYESLSRNLPMMVIIGNHENESSNYYSYMKYDDFSDFSWPLSEKFYSFYYLNQQFIFINGNGTYSNSIQTNWLEDKLTESAQNPDVDMVFCFTHQPGHSELWPDGNTDYIQNDVIPLLRQYDKVQLLAYGHSHNYERGTIESTVENSNGDYYIMLTGGAGSALDRWGMYPNQQDYDEIMISFDHYLYNIVDIDLQNKSFELFTYSLGNTDKPLDNVLVDYYYRKLDQEPPIKPVALSPLGQTGVLPLLVTSDFEGADSLMSSKFQITSTPGNYTSPIFEKRQDWVNIYGDSGAPDYIPIDLNEGIDLRRLQVTTTLTDGNQYAWRVRYRDFNLKWSDWSDEQVFTVNENLTEYTDFAADLTEGYIPLTITFTDLSYPAVDSWTWDFDNDGLEDSYEQDPEFVFELAGFYSVKLTTPNGVEIKDLYINAEDTTVKIIENKSNDILRINPNPCYGNTNIEFYVKENNHVKLSIVNSKGQVVAILADEMINAGKHNITWDTKTQAGDKLSSGNYFVKLEYGKINEIKKLVVIDK
jgi:PKD repeat protein/predicted phosphodiesterase